jgi:hypothetical protein
LFTTTNFVINFLSRKMSSFFVKRGNKKYRKWILLQVELLLLLSYFCGIPKGGTKGFDAGLEIRLDRVCHLGGAVVWWYTGWVTRSNLASSHFCFIFYFLSVSLRAYPEGSVAILIEDVLLGPGEKEMFLRYPTSSPTICAPMQIKPPHDSLKKNTALLRIFIILSLVWIFFYLL